MEIEFCIYTIEEAIVARSYGVQRVELCRDLHLGGLTPLGEDIQRCVDIGGPETHVLIRPREGDFNYGESELLQMKISIQEAARHGAYGVVFGVLDDINSIDIEKNAELLNLADHLGLETTFHRAFDGLNDHESALELLIDLGFTRVLTSCGRAIASDAVETFRALSHISRARIEVMAGGNIRPENAHIFSGTGVNAIHFSVSNYLDRMNADPSFDLDIDTEKIEGILNAIKVP